MLVARQNFGEIEGSPNLADARACIAGTRDVIEQVVEQIGYRMLVEGRRAEIDHVLQLAVDLAEEAP